MTQRPLILGIICNLRRHETGIGHTVNVPYLRAIEHYTDCHAMLIPCLMEEQTEDHLLPLLSHVDGLLLTGSRTNIHPTHYGVNPSAEHEPFDEMRDRTSLFLAQWAIDNGMPLLGICRGLQEINVALGGTLCPAIHEEVGKFDHRMPDTDDFDFNHRDRHEISIEPNGLLAQIFGTANKRVNSLHRQGIDQLGQGLRVEAYAQDNSIEAVSHQSHPFALGVQWHPEHQTGINEVSKPLFAAFETAMRERQ